MILAIDMGNSNIVVGGLDDNKTYFEERITTDDRKTSLEYAILLKNILEIHKVKKNDIEGSIMASVVPPLNAPISSAVKKITGKKPFLVGSGMKTGLNIKMDNPKTVGGDRDRGRCRCKCQIQRTDHHRGYGNRDNARCGGPRWKLYRRCDSPGCKGCLKLPRFQYGPASEDQLRCSETCDWKEHHRMYEKRYHAWQCRNA